MSLTVSIPNYEVQKVGRNKYYVQSNNGSFAVVNKSNLKKLAKANDGIVKHDYSVLGKVAMGVGVLGAIAAGVVFRKNIAKTAGKVADGIKTSKLSDKIKNTKQPVKGLFGKVKIGKVFLSVLKGLKKAFSAVKKFFGNIFGKASNDAQKTGSNLSDKVKQGVRGIKNFFKRNKKSKIGTIFDLGSNKNNVLRPETKKAKTEALAAIAKDFDAQSKNVSRNTSNWKKAFAEKYGAENVK